MATVASNDNKTVFVSIQAFIKNELAKEFFSFEGFRYKYKNNGPDECSFTLKLSDVFEVDEPYLQEKVELRVQWGYLGGETSKVRKVYIESLAYDYVDYGVEVQVKALDKGASLSKGKKRQVIKDKTLDEIASMMAELKGIKYSPIPLEFEGSDEAILRGYYDTDGKREGFIIQNEETLYKAIPAIDNTSVKKLAFFEKKIPSYTQANTTDKFVLDDLLNQTEGGPYIAETRDDTLTIKKKSLSSKPVKSYTYKGEDGKLLQFKPETKNKARGTQSTKVRVGSWDEENKEFYEADATEFTDDNTRLGEEVNLPPDDHTAELQELANKSDSPYALEDLEFKYAVPNKISTATESFKVRDVTDSYDKYFPAVENTAVQIQTFDFFNPFEYGDYLQGKEVNKEGVPPEGNNRRTNQALENNPGSCSIEAEPMLESDMVITILNVAKKHEGNYYIDECEHILGDTYLVECKLKRNGTGRVNTNDATKVDVGLLSKSINKLVGSVEILPTNDIPTVKPEDYKNE